MPPEDRGAPDGRPPRLSIILPTYDRARFMPEAIASIRAQAFDDWELIVVDDGSTDGTRGLVEELFGGVRQPTRYVYQENQGAYGARNTGMDLARGQYVAFFDSDDLWLPHHLRDCVAALDENQDVDWVYGAGRQVEESSGAILWPHSFYDEGQPRPFLGLEARHSGSLRIIDDPTVVSCLILQGLYCGLQNSVLRVRVFDRLRFPPYPVGEDQAFAILALKSGYRLGYLDDIHVLKLVHPGGVSAGWAGSNFSHQVGAIRSLVEALESLSDQVDFTRRERVALRRRISRELFWTLGYSLLGRNGDIEGAQEAYRRALGTWPWDPLCWKTICVSWLRCLRFRSPDEERTIRIGGTAEKKVS